MRLHKSDKEVALMQKAADIAGEAHILAMKKSAAGHERVSGRVPDGIVYA
jgi:Xaa-Pro aminopeptidase